MARKYSLAKIGKVVAFDALANTTRGVRPSVKALSVTRPVWPPARARSASPAESLGIGIIAGTTTAGQRRCRNPRTERRRKKPATLTRFRALDFAVKANYQLDTRRAQGDRRGQRSDDEEAGQFTLLRNRKQESRAGQVFIVISNTSATPISTFSNLPDGSIFTAGRNSYQANYGRWCGDGNDSNVDRAMTAISHIT